METSEKIVAAIRPFGVPCVPDLYTGGAKRFVTYNFADDYGTDFADDQPETVVNSMQIHFFMPANESYISWKKKSAKLCLMLASHFRKLSYRQKMRILSDI